MSRLVARWNGYWFREAPLFDLGVLRILAVGYLLAWTLAGGVTEQLVRAAARPDADYEPVLLAELLSAGIRPAHAWLSALHALTIAAGCFALVGLATRATLAAFALGILYLQGHAYSFGPFHHAEAPLCIGLVALAASPAGRALSVDHWLERRRAEEPLADTSPLASFAPLLMRWVVALVFLSAAASKLGSSGLEWANGYTLQYAAFAKGAQLRTPLGVWLSEHHDLCRALSWIVLAFESSFFLAVLRPGLARFYVPIAAALVAAIELTIGARFHPLLVLLCAFVPWHRLRPAERARRSDPAPAGL